MLVPYLDERLETKTWDQVQAVSRVVGHLVKNPRHGPAGMLGRPWARQVAGFHDSYGVGHEARREFHEELAAQNYVGDGWPRVDGLEEATRGSHQVVEILKCADLGHDCADELSRQVGNGSHLVVEENVAFWQSSLILSVTRGRDTRRMTDSDPGGLFVTDSVAVVASGGVTDGCLSVGSVAESKSQPRKPCDCE